MYIYTIYIYIYSLMMIKKRRITVLDHLAFPVRNHTQSKEELSKKKGASEKKWRSLQKKRGGALLVYLLLLL
jgi:hypothetical protein